MKRRILHITTIILISLSLFSCKHNEKTIKLSSKDPFQNTIVPSQSITIDASVDNVVEGEKGSIIICPKGCFVDRNGKIVEKNIDIEIAEALSLEDMLLSNLTTTSDGQLLETDGMIYFNATSDGEQLYINKENPIHIEIPTHQKKPGMMAYKGVRDAEGNMNWVEPKKIDDFLKTVDINSLNFLPEKFETAVDKGMPFRNYKVADKKLADSLYNSLSVWREGAFTKGFVPTDYNEPYYNEQKEVINGKYSDRSFLVDSSDERSLDNNYDPDAGECGIDPALIKVIQNSNYQNTFIATKEFESRLQILFKTCNTNLLLLYLDNLNKNLYEVDSMVAKKLAGSEHQNTFLQFMELRQTKVKEADKYAALLEGYYEKQLKEVTGQLNNEQKKVLKELEKKNKEAQRLADDYKKLLFKREKYRMETYGFEWTNTGWVNIDIGTIPKTWSPQPLEIIVENGKDLDRTYTYIVYTSIRSLYRLNTSDNVIFTTGNKSNNNVHMPKALSVAIGIGYKGDIPYIALKEFEPGKDQKISMTLTQSTPEKVKEMIRPYDKYVAENKIDVDLEYMAKFYEEKQRQLQLKKEDEFIRSLYDIAFPCCAKNGEELFVSYCQRCHVNFDEAMTGPSLVGVTSKYSSEWLYQWTIDSQKLIKSGDADAVKIYEQYQSIQPAFNLTRIEVNAIYDYIDGLAAM